jgi:hypothetical protein
MGSITGIVGIANQDAAVQESMGPITDRSKEHLGSSDAGVIVFRKRLLALARDGAKMEALPGLDPGTHRVRSVSLVLEPGQSWLEASKALRHADPSFYSAHMEVQ